MQKLTSRERITRVIEGQEIDRIPTFDIIHNIDLIEYYAEEKLTFKNAEDLLCKAASKCFDMIRHFAAPTYERIKTVKDSEGFIYRYEWWTGHLVERPKLKDVVNLMKKDIEKIYIAEKNM